MSPAACELHAYGIYLLNGGTPEGYMSMDDDDIALMYATYTANQIKSATMLADRISSSILGALSQVL